MRLARKTVNKTEAVEVWECEKGFEKVEVYESMGAVVSGCIILWFGIFSWKLVPLIQALPKAFVSILVGFALLGVFGNSLSVGFSKPTLKMSVPFAFVIAVSNISIFNIGAPVWALVFGTFIARYVEDSHPMKTKGKGLA